LAEIHSLELKDCLAVAEAHMNYLRTPFRGNAGIQLLKLRYEVIASQKGGIGFVAREDGKFAGYVCGVWDRGAIRKSLLKRWSSLIINGVQQVVQSPKTIPGFLRRATNPRTIGIVKIDGYELRPLVVLPSYRGRRIADQLTQRLLDDAKQRGYGQVFLVTEMDNFAAAKFYTKFGFKFEKEVNLEGAPEKLFRYYFPANDA
jgi:ribosomal protein S18 acetylase RimI-like enzyme